MWWDYVQHRLLNGRRILFFLLFQRARLRGLLVAEPGLGSFISPRLEEAILGRFRNWVISSDFVRFLSFECVFVVRIRYTASHDHSHSVVLNGQWVDMEQISDKRDCEEKKQLIPLKTRKVSWNPMKCSATNKPSKAQSRSILGRQKSHFEVFENRETRWNPKKKCSGLRWESTAGEPGAGGCNPVKKKKEMTRYETRRPEWRRSDCFLTWAASGRRKWNRTPTIANKNKKKTGTFFAVTVVFFFLLGSIFFDGSSESSNRFRPAIARRRCSDNVRWQPTVSQH